MLPVRAVAVKNQLKFAPQIGLVAVMILFEGSMAQKFDMD